MASLTPMMRQYLELHEQAQDCLLLFRLGDFYEMFFDDAIRASKDLDLVLTGRDAGMDEKAPMCGVPAQSLDSYVAKLVEKGYKVAIAEQVGDPKSAKGIVERQIIRIVSSGTIYDSLSQSPGKNNYIAVIYYSKTECAIAYADISTGEAYASAVNVSIADKSALLDRLSLAMPSEILANSVLYSEDSLKSSIENLCSVPLGLLDSSYYGLEAAYESINAQLGSYSATGVGLEGSDSIARACGALLRYLKDTQKNSLQHINSIKVIASDGCMALDYSTKRNLELTEASFAKTRKGSLLWALDYTASGVGARELKKWLLEPLTSKAEIERRYGAIEELMSDARLISELGSIISKMSDIQRLCSKIAYKSALGKDLLALEETIRLIGQLKASASGLASSFALEHIVGIDPLEDIAELINSAIDRECATTSSLIREGFDEKLDGIKKLQRESKEYLLEIEHKERESSGIKNLKIKYSRVFGYCFEVTKSNMHLVPSHFIRKQTLANAERFYTSELKELEEKLDSASEEIDSLQSELYQGILDQLALCVKRIFATASHLGQYDAIRSLAFAAFENSYVRPAINETGELRIINGRHPVIEKLLEKKAFIGNDTLMDNGPNRMLIITGPNMAGKSTYIRQTAIIALMAQMGSFVPADEADLPIIDRIFTRVGASDDLVGGQSTFMLEMSEASNIIRNATKDSLIILDEIGRGTSTFDGMSIARAILEHICSVSDIGAKCMFATHYHELTELEELMQGVKNYSMSISQSLSGLYFTHKITKGPQDKSYGIEVAKLAGLPGSIIARAEEILFALESNASKKPKRALKPQARPEMDATSLLNYKSNNLLLELKALPLNEMTPVEVMGFVAKLQNELGDI
ncbi:MAG: DNA mismatch repair protein MutS [Eubacteriaceae bacterium]|nr:DNA mismatch repair protein MutS [Eubacteriaceae bacterium]